VALEESEQRMQQVISKEQLWEKITLLDSFQQQTVLTFIDALLDAQPAAGRRDKRRLLALSLWTDEDIQRIEEAQDRINAWQLPTF
jgi:hypothetical protein